MAMRKEANLPSDPFNVDDTNGVYIYHCSTSGHPVCVGIAKFLLESPEQASIDGLKRSLHGQGLCAPKAFPSANVVAISDVRIKDAYKDKPYTFPYKNVEGEPVPVTLGDINTRGVYAWDCLATLPRTHLEEPELQIETPPPTHGSGGDGNAEVVDKDTGKDIHVVSYENDTFWRAVADVHFQQIFRNAHPIRGVNTDTVQALIASMRERKYMQAQGMITVTETISCGDVILTAPSGTQFPMSPHMRFAVVDGRHRCLALAVLHKEYCNTKDEELEWTDKPLRVSIVGRRDGKALTPLHVVRLSVDSNIASSIVYKTQSFVQLLRSLMRFAVMFEKTFSHSVLQVKQTMLARHINYSKLLCGSSSSTMKRYVRLLRLFWKVPGLLDDLAEYNEEPPDLDVDHDTNPELSAMPEAPLDENGHVQSQKYKRANGGVNDAHTHVAKAKVLVDGIVPSNPSGIVRIRLLHMEGLTHHGLVDPSDARVLLGCTYFSLVTHKGGGMEFNGPMFYKAAIAFLGELRKVAARYHETKTWEEFLDMQDPTAHNSKNHTLRERIFYIMRLFGYKKSDDSAKYMDAHKARVGKFIRNLHKIYTASSAAFDSEPDAPVGLGRRENFDGNSNSNGDEDNMQGGAERRGVPRDSNHEREAGVEKEVESEVEQEVWAGLEEEEAPEVEAEENAGEEAEPETESEEEVQEIDGGECHVNEKENIMGATPGNDLVVSRVNKQSIGDVLTRTPGKLHVKRGDVEGVENNIEAECPISRVAGETQRTKGCQPKDCVEQDVAALGVGNKRDPVHDNGVTRDETFAVNRSTRMHSGTTPSSLPRIPQVEDVGITLMPSDSDTLSNDIDEEATVETPGEGQSVHSAKRTKRMRRISKRSTDIVIENQPVRKVARVTNLYLEKRAVEHRCGVSRGQLDKEFENIRPSQYPPVYHNENESRSEKAVDSSYETLFVTPLYKLSERERKTVCSKASVFLRCALLSCFHHAGRDIPVQEMNAMRRCVDLKAAQMEMLGGPHTRSCSRDLIGRKLMSQKMVSMEDISEDTSSAIRDVYFRERCVELKEKGFTMLPKFLLTVGEGGTRNFYFEKPEVDKFFEWFENKFGDKTYWKQRDRERNLRIGNNKAGGRKGKERWTFALPSDSLTGNEEMTKVLETKTRMDLFCGIVGRFLGLDSRGRVFTPNIGSCILRDDPHVYAEEGHNDFPIVHGNKDASPGYFSICTGPQALFLLVVPGSHRFVHYPEERRRMLCKALCMEEVCIPPYSLFYGNGHLHKGSAAGTGVACTYLHMYYIPEGMSLPNSKVHGLMRPVESVGSRHPQAVGMLQEARKKSDSNVESHEDQISNDVYARERDVMEEG